VKHETSTDYRHPYRPPIVRIANRVAERLPAVPPFRASLDQASLLRAARKRTGLTDFGDPSFFEPLGILLQSIEDEARLHALGRLITRTRVVSMLSTRLRLEDLCRREPSIDRQRLTRPIVIVGLPRTGTTFLHRLLASDETRIRSLASWEALMPVPAGGDAPTASRIAAAERSESALKYLAPDFFAVHPIDARGPEEEILLLDLAFRSTVPEATMYVPTYARWLESADQSPAYRQMARALKALQWQRAPSAAEFRWVLKTPHHLEWLDELPAVLDDPLVVWTHRAPREVVGSFCSMIAHGRGIFSDHVDPIEIGRAWLRKGKRMVERAMDARARLGERNVLDVRYEDLIADPLAVARAVLERAGLPWTAESDVRIRRSLQTEVKDRHGKHRYSLADFGLSAGEVDRAFEAYLGRSESPSILRSG
jgi:hypothetical protein